MAGSKKSVGIDFRPDPSARAPIYLQLAGFLSAAIRNGHVPIGTRLPSERQLADTVRVSRTTVTSAYEELKTLGLLRGYVGRGALVIADDPEQAMAGAIAWAQLASRRAPPPLPASAANTPAVISFSDGWLHPTLVPHRALAACAAEAVLQPDILAKAAPLLGLPSLREALVEHLGGMGVRTTTAELLVTTGAQQGLNVIARALVTHGDTVVCENPTWYGATRAFRAAGAEVVGIGMDHEGIDPDALEDALIRRRPKLVYLIPSFQCPTGSSLSRARRCRILEICTRLHTPIVESHVYGELAFDERMPSLKSLDNAGIVIHQGSASKSISPALRVGWLVAPPAALELLAPAKASLDLSTPALTQATLAAFLKGAAHARLQLAFRRALRERRDALMASLARHCPALRCARPEGGLYLWAQLPNRLPARAFESAAAAAGIAVRSGDAFMTHGAASTHVRLCFAAPALEDIPAGAQCLGKALRTALLQHRAAEGPASTMASV